MGSFTNNLSRRLRHRRTLNEINGGVLPPAKPWKSPSGKMEFSLEDDHEDDLVARGIPKLTSVALMRDGTLHKGFKSHADLRRSLGDTDPYTSTRGDTEGFYTSDDRFVTRREASFIAAEAGQAHQSVAGMGRDFLSSDIDKW